MGFPKTKNNNVMDLVDDSFVLSEAELVELEKKIRGYGSREALLIANHAVKKDEDGRICLLDQIGAIGAPTGLGKHCYKRSLLHVFWDEAFRQLDRYQSHKMSAVSRREKFQQIRESLGIGAVPAKA